MEFSLIHLFNSVFYRAVKQTHFVLLRKMNVLEVGNVRLTQALVKHSSDMAVREQLVYSEADDNVYVYMDT